MQTLAQHHVVVVYTYSVNTEAVDMGTTINNKHYTCSFNINITCIHLYNYYNNTHHSAWSQAQNEALRQESDYTVAVSSEP